MGEGETVKRRTKYFLLIGVMISALLIASQLLAQDRTYEYFVPENIEDGAPLLIFLHGRTGTGKEMEEMTHFNTLAEREGFVMLYPDGIIEDWNFGFGPKGVDDLAFLQNLVDEFVEKYKIDRERVYLMGLSNGGRMAYYAACQLPGTFAAVASIDAPMMVVTGDECASEPVPMLVMMGTKDPILPWEGYPGSMYSAEGTFLFWAEHNGCLAEQVESEDLPDVEPSDESTVSVKTYTDCEEEARVTLYTVEGGGHTYPGNQREAEALRVRLGVTNMDIDASEVLWEWFESLEQAE